MAFPVGRARGHKDDDWATMSTLGDVRAPGVVLSGGGGGTMAIVLVGGRAFVCDQLLELRTCMDPAAPRYLLDPPFSFLPVPAAPTVLTALLPVVKLCRITGTANASLHNLVAKSALETVATLVLVLLRILAPYADSGAYSPFDSSIMVPSAGLVAAVVGVAVASIEATRHVETLTIASPLFVPSTVREVHVRSNLDDSSDCRTCISTRLLLAEVQAPLFLLLRALRDAGAGVHVNVNGSKAFGA